MDAFRTFWRDFRDRLVEALPRGADFAALLVQICQVVVITAVTLFLASRIKNWVARLLGRSWIGPNLIALAGNGAFMLTVVVGVTWLLKALGATSTAIVTGLSVITVAVGLSVQDILRNLVAGVYLLVEQPFQIGDEIAVKGITGEVEGIDIRTTILRTDEGLQVLVPNSVVFTEVVTNRSAYDTRRVALVLREVETPFKDLSRLVREALRPFEEIAHTPAPRVTIRGVNDGSSTVAVEYWQRGDAPILPEVLARLKDAFPEADIAVTSTGVTQPAPAPPSPA